VPELRLPTAAARFIPRSGYVRFVVGEVPLGQVFSKYFGFLCLFSFQQLLQIIILYHPGLMPYLA
jgi:hypothetical protein